MYAYYCLHKFHWLPSQFAELSLNEKAMVMAMIDERLKEEKKEQAKIKKRR
ncbi:TPA: hypothetical protein ACF2DS_000166 [Clostridium perfringens]|uniref:hypothetical protein n=1 Tax=Clostridium perfringens TaxID=1502 RepID=UPI003673D999